MSKVIEPGDSVMVCTLRGQWEAVVSNICVNVGFYGNWGWFEVEQCENIKLNGAIFDLKTIEHCSKTAHFNCDKQPLSSESGLAQLQHHYNCWALFD